MAIYSQGMNTTVTTTGSPAADAKAGANSPRLMEIGISLGAATASTYGLVRSANTPSQTSPVLLQAEFSGDPASLTGTAVAWGTPPTSGGNYFRRCGLPGTIGIGVVWTFPRGINIPTTASLVVWNLATNSANTNIWWAVDE